MRKFIILYLHLTDCTWPQHYQKFIVNLCESMIWQQTHKTHENIPLIPLHCITEHDTIALHNIPI